MINDLPTLFEVASGRKAVKDKPSMDSGSKSRNSTKVKCCDIYFMPFPLTEKFRIDSNQLFSCRDHWTGRLETAIQSYWMRVMERRKTSMVILCVGAVEGTTTQMNFGLDVTYARGGSMENV